MQDLQLGVSRADFVCGRYPTNYILCWFHLLLLHQQYEWNDDSFTNLKPLSTYTFTAVLSHEYPLLVLLHCPLVLTRVGLSHFDTIYVEQIGNLLVSWLVFALKQFKNFLLHGTWHANNDIPVLLNCLVKVRVSLPIHFLFDFLNSELKLLDLRLQSHHLIKQQTNITRHLLFRPISYCDSTIAIQPAACLYGSLLYTLLGLLAFLDASYTL